MTEPALDFLTVLEEREARLLSWGYVDGSFELAELEQLADEFVLAHGTPATGGELLDELQRRALLLEVQDGADVRHRTRMAETIRLLASLRQLFPRNAGVAWRSAPTLVADYRMLTRPRSYPKRDVEVVDAMAELAADGLLPEARRATMTALLARRSPAVRLARFQVDATRDVLAGLDGRGGGATIVGAGTGSGKTLAFYLPALAHVAAVARARPATRVLAIYPRVELLRDQFAEAYRETLLLDGVGSLGRPLRIGALYGKTPTDLYDLGRRRWERRGEDLVCPYLTCPQHRCDGKLVWAAPDIRAKRSRLVCERCDREVEEGRIALTRREMRDLPPDVLFTTTEMLNRTLSDGSMRHLIGAGPDAMPIDLLLLDEVHTHEGVTGAHVAGLLRRWRHAQRRPVHVVGLSATLRDPTEFIGKLAGVRADRVTAIEPKQNEFDHEGREYMVALRSNPHSGAGPLSTTIQTAMLLQRALDPLGRETSGRAFGHKLFAFTDDLDVTNRLFRDLLDAEGMRAENRRYRPPLAALRQALGEDVAARRAAGQTWEALEQIGHRFGEHDYMRIGRTSSQDADVDPAATAIAATASLEVGFNDPGVGAVLQHKAPHGTAPFLQRKGRAGRRREMRPWTVVVLSDFGRDRTTYQSYERLFDPEVMPNALPVDNPSVVRMQAIFATLDWITAKLRLKSSAYVRLQYPPDARYRGTPEQAAAIAELIRRVLTDPATRGELTAHLVAALDLDEQLVSEIFWQPPRPLVTQVLPTALRRLESGWRHLALGAGRDTVGDGPLPEFVISRLFGDLALPEIDVIVPPRRPGGRATRETMRAFQAMTAFAPGRVSHRIPHVGARYWVEAPRVGPADVAMDVRGFAPAFEELGVFGRERGRPVRVVRPLSIAVRHVPDEFLSSSHGRLEWDVEILPEAPAAEQVEPPLGSPLAGLVDKVAFHTHGALTQVEVRRWATSARLESRAHDATQRGTVRLQDGDEPVGVGLALEVDALVADVLVPDGLLSGRPVDDAHMRGLRVERFRDRLTGNRTLVDRLGTFETQRLADAVLLALIDSAMASGGDLQTVYAELCDEHRLVPELRRTLERRPPDDTSDAREGRAETVQRRTEELLAALAERSIRNALDVAIRALWQQPDADWDAWAGRRLAVTVGAALQGALAELCPEFDAEDVCVDVVAAVPGEGDGGERRRLRVWVTEQTIGGGGLIQEAVRRASDRPRRFFELVAAAAELTFGEIVDDELQRVVAAAQRGGPMAAALTAVREAHGIGERATAFDALLETLRREGVFVCHPVVSALSVRMLRPGGSTRIDAAIAGLLERWHALEDELGVDVDLRTFAEFSARDGSFERAAGLTPPAHGDAMAWRTGQIASVLWPRGGELRRQGLHAPNQFAQLPEVDGMLLRDNLAPASAPATVADADLALGAEGPLARQGEVDLTASADELAALRRTILEAAATPIESGPVLHYPRVAGVRRSRAQLDVRLVVDMVGE